MDYGKLILLVIVFGCNLYKIMKKDYHDMNVYLLLLSGFFLCGYLPLYYVGKVLSAACLAGAAGYYLYRGKKNKKTIL